MSISRKTLVHLVCATNVNEGTGVATFLKSVHDNQALLHNCNVSIYERRGSIESLNNKNRYSNPGAIRRFLRRMKKLVGKVGFDLVSLMPYLYSGYVTTKNYLRQRDSMPDIIHFHDIFSCFGYILYGDGPSKVFLTLHSNGNMFSMLESEIKSARTGLSGIVLRFIEKKITTNVEVFGFVSNSSMNNFSKKHPDHKTFYVYNGIKDVFEGDKKSRLFAASDSKMRIACVGTVCSRKNQEVLIRALKQVDKNTRSNVEIQFIGSGPKLKELELLADELGVGESVKFLGLKKNVIEYLLKADAFILPSKDEGLPMSIIEAMMCGLPIFSSNVGGVFEMIDKNGLLVNNSEGEWANILENIASNMYDLVEMSNNSRGIYMSKFEIKRMMSSYDCNWAAL